MTAPSESEPSAGSESPRQPTTQELPVVTTPSGGTAPTGPPVPANPVPAADGPQPTGPVDFVPGLPGPGTPRPQPAMTGAMLPPPPGVAPPAPVTPHLVPSEPVPIRAEGPLPTAASPAWPESLDEAHSQSQPHPHDEPRIHDQATRSDGNAVGASAVTGVPRPGGPAGVGAARRLAGRVPAPRTLVGLGLAVLSLVLLEVGLLGEFGDRSYWSAVTLWSAFATGCAALAVVASVPVSSRFRAAPAWRVAAGGLVGMAVFWVLVVLPEVASDRGFVLTAALAALGAALWVGARHTED